MGIRAVCPNGHRLHLKAQLAGRRGLCPDCGARFRIPFESSEIPQPFAEPPNRKKKQTSTESFQESLEAVVSPSQTAPSSSGAPSSGVPSSENLAGNLATATPAPAAGAADATPAPLAMPVNAVPVNGAAEPVTAEPVAAVVAEPAMALPALSANDPLGESPHALWYVQPPSGGRYGPAKANVLQQWIAEGRVTESCLVWRDGWSEWQPASTILGGRESVPNGTVAGPSEEAEFLPIGSHSNLRHRRKGSKGVGISMIVILTLACLLLLVILMVAIATGKISI